MGLKETLAKKILEMKLSGATKNMRAAIQKLQQQYDELVNENKDKKQFFLDNFLKKVGITFGSLNFFLYVYTVMRDKDMKIKEYYLEMFPTDELGVEINPQATFDGLFGILDNYEDVYEYIGVCDSIIRERCFEKLSQIMGCDYNVIYDQWLTAV